MKRKTSACLWCWCWVLVMLFPMLMLSIACQSYWRKASIFHSFNVIFYFFNFFSPQFFHINNAINLQILKCDGYYSKTNHHQMSKHYNGMNHNFEIHRAQECWKTCASLFISHTTKGYVADEFACIIGYIKLDRLFDILRGADRLIS